MFQDIFIGLLNHTCDIYHLTASSAAVGFGFDVDDHTHGYSDTPDISGQICHFHTKSNATVITQNEPENKLSIVRKLSLPIGTDVRINDKVVDCDTGIEYTAGLPVNVRDHHLSVELYRTVQQEAL